jgi:hypothetical protein
MSADKVPECPHGEAACILCSKCAEADGYRFTTLARIGAKEMAHIDSGAEWEFKVEGVPAATPRRRLTLRLNEHEAELIFKHAYLSSTGSLVKYKLRSVVREYLGSFLMDLIDATGLPILILPWGDPIHDWQMEP